MAEWQTELAAEPVLAEAAAAIAAGREDDWGGQHGARTGVNDADDDAGGLEAS